MKRPGAAGCNMAIVAGNPNPEKKNGQSIFKQLSDSLFCRTPPRILVFMFLEKKSGNPNPNPRKKKKKSLFCRTPICEASRQPRILGFMFLEKKSGNPNPKPRKKTVRNCVEKTRGGRSQYRRSCGEPRVTLTLEKNCPKLC